MKLAHVGMNISRADWSIFSQHLVDTLDSFSVPATERQEVLSFVDSLRDDIVEA